MNAPVVEIRVSGVRPARRVSVLWRAHRVPSLSRRHPCPAPLTNWEDIWEADLWLDILSFRLCALHAYQRPGASPTGTL